MAIRAENKEDHFHRLPQELSIFDRVADLKCLCRCSLVSKHFAAVVSQVQTVSVNVTRSATYDEGYLKRIRTLVSELKNLKAEQRNAFLDSSSFQHMKLPVFFDNLTEVKFIYLDFDNPEKSVNSHIPMPKIKFCSNGAKIESFLALESLSMHKDTENQVGEVDNIINHFPPLLKGISHSWLTFMVRYMEWICFVMVLKKCHGSVERVTITDSEVHGKLVIGDEQGAKLEFGYLVKLTSQLSGFIARVGWVPVLHLPLSGYVMRWVALKIVYLPQNSRGRAKNLDEIACLDELPVFCEAVKEFLKKRKDMLIIPGQ